jgi:hypothetical protein
MGKRKYKSIVMKDFKINEDGELVKYKVGDTYFSYKLSSVRYLKQIKLIK